MVRPRFLATLSESFSQDKRLDRDIQKSVTGSSTSISKTGLDIRERLTDYPLVEKLEHDQTRYVVYVTT